MPDPLPTFRQRLQRHWFEPGDSLLRPAERLVLRLVEWFYCLAVLLRNRLAGPSYGASVHGIRSLAVGNLIIGGAGKTPSVMALAKLLKASGRKAGILSRGYKSQAEDGPGRVIDPQDLASVSAQEVGDEAWLLCWRTELPVAIGKDRLASLRALLQRFPQTEIVILDDGLSQRSLSPDRTLLVMDSRGFGNHHCLPLGPLREPAVRLNRFDAWVDNGFSETGLQERLPAQGIRLTQRNELWIKVENWQTPESWLGLEQGVAHFRKGRILAVAGIAVPERFFKTLHGLSLDFEAMPLDDHDPELVDRVIRHCKTHDYQFILMTEKDAVKFFHHPCDIRERIWALRRQAELEPDAIERLLNGL